MLASNENHQYEILVKLAAPFGTNIAYTIHMANKRIASITLGPKSIEYAGIRALITGHVRLEDLGQGPYFSMTGDIIDESKRFTSGRFLAGGCIHEEIAEAFPEYAEFIKWHLVSVVSGPMHYLANAKYWAGYCGFCDDKSSSPPNFEHLKHTTVWGVLPNETEGILREFMSPTPLAGWTPHKQGNLFDEFSKPLEELLLGRYEALMQVFYADMVRVFPGQITVNAAVPTLHDLGLIREKYQQAKTV